MTGVAVPPARPELLRALGAVAGDLADARTARLGEAAGQTRVLATAGTLTRARRALFWEHLWPWLPG